MPFLYKLHKVAHAYVVFSVLAFLVEPAALYVTGEFIVQNLFYAGGTSWRCYKSSISCLFFFHSCRTKIVIESPIVRYGYLDLYVHEQFGIPAQESADFGAAQGNCRERSRWDDERCSVQQPVLSCQGGD